MATVDEDKGGLFFLYGHGGTGKTFIWKTLLSCIRSRGDIVLTVISSGIACLLLPGGRTSHSRFVIPLNPTEDATRNIKQGSPLANLIVKTKLIIWDEAPMMQRYYFEALDQTLKDILRFKNTSSLDKPFGGKTIVLGGDFRQILPVITKETSSIDGIETIQIPDDLLIKDCVDPILEIVKSMYPDFYSHSRDLDYLQQRAILAPTLDMVESINDFMVSLNHNSEKTYLSSDTVCRSDHSFMALEHVHTPEFLNSIKCSGIPNHSITLKIGVPIILLRNIDQSSGLCKGTRLIITRLRNRVIEAKVLSGKMAGEKVFIPRMSLIPSDARIPFKFQQRQFPIIVSFSMTINKSQGQSLSHVGLFFKKSMFTHGQLYIALSRVTSRKGLKILACDDEGKITNEVKNIVYKKGFRNLV
ncbi:ATP-dependent DNA helicase PIF1-like [Capsicum annuum]|uniref:ATP-dependent DNA helicase PIF1-like n=1 Tax=Capsicum annuum TaxID=4072 RepID=UPI001FB0BAA9|nr:ATP-dependent DNA helicase PIF1-like [Capsicum annuum]